MPATIKDIAKKVGVNPSTVSRVINGTASISEEKRQKIKDAMKELYYTSCFCGNRGTDRPTAG
mgnify:CR=1 FL=1